MTLPNISLDSSLPAFLKNIGSRLPFWPTVIIAGIIPVIGLLIIDNLFVPFDFLDAFLVAYWIFSVLIVYFIYAMRFSWIRVEKLLQYAHTMSRDNTTLQVHSPLRLSWILFSWLGLLGGITLLFGVPDDPRGIFGEHVILLSYFFLVSSSFLLVYGYSMLVIYRAGKLPLELKPFTEDRTLGLRPFGTVSLRLASIYAVFPLVNTILNTLSITASPTGVQVSLSPWRPSDIALTTILVIIGVGLFLLPLQGIHRQLVEAKRKELNWLNPKYSVLIRRMKQGDQTQTGAYADELSLIRQIQADIGQIREWPFSLGMITRLATVLLLPSILAVTGRLMVIIILHV